MPVHIDADVIVVGAGPTGLMAANCLIRLGVSAIVVDGKTGPTRESRALVLQSRTMEILDQIDVVDQVLHDAEVASAIVPGFEKHEFRSVPLSRLAEGTTPYPHLYVLEQSRNERLLVENLRRLGGDVLWSHAVEALDVEPGGVVVRCSRPDGEDAQIRARFCIGADGSSSLVRRLREIPFGGTTNDHVFYVLDAVGVSGLATGSINLRFGERDFLLTFPMGNQDHHRLLGVVRRTDRREVDETRVSDTLAGAFAVRFSEAAWLSTYRVHHRVAGSFQSGRVFLAGDAAHVHSPVGAQGMNTGLQDAHNLACKLADVIQGRAPESYLARYDAERRPVALRLVSTTDEMFGVITSERMVPRFLRRHLIPALAPVAVRLLPKLPQSSRIFEYLSQTRIHYWMGAADKHLARGRRGGVVGRRVPWNGDNFDSLRTMAWQVHAYGNVDQVEVERLASSLGVSAHHFPVVRNKRLTSGILLLVRPDAFVAASSYPREAARVFREALPAGWAGRHR